LHAQRDRFQARAVGAFDLDLAFARLTRFETRA